MIIFNRNNAEMIKMKIEPQWLNQKQAAQYMGVCVNTFIDWRTKFNIESRTIGKITRWDKRELDRVWKEIGVAGY